MTFLEVLGIIFILMILVFFDAVRHVMFFTVAVLWNKVRGKSWGS